MTQGNKMQESKHNYTKEIEIVKNARSKTH